MGFRGQALLWGREPVRRAAPIGPVPPGAGTLRDSLEQTERAAIDAARDLGLRRGANVIMPNITPPCYRCRYTIYPGKACAVETADACAGGLPERLARIGRRPGFGPDGRPSLANRHHSVL